MCLNFHPFLSKASLVARMVKHPPAVQETRVRFLGREGPRRRECLSTLASLPGESHGQATVHGVGKRQTRLRELLSKQGIRLLSLCSWATTVYWACVVSRGCRVSFLARTSLDHKEPAQSILHHEHIFFPSFFWLCPGVCGISVPGPSQGLNLGQGSESLES